MEELGGLQSTGCKESDTTEQLHFHFHLIYNILLVQVNIEVIQLYIIYVYTYILFNFFITGYDKILTIIPCAIHKVLVF